MQSRTTVLTATALALGAALAVTVPARAAQPLQISGKNTCKTTEQHAIPVEGDPDHVLVVQKGTCSTSATGQSSRFFDGAQFTFVATGDYVKGNGPFQGYLLSNYKDGSTIAERFIGEITTTMVDGKPHTTWHGTWESRNGTGTGSMVNAHLRGTFKNEAVVSPTESVDEWEGTVTEERKQ